MIGGVTASESPKEQAKDESRCGRVELFCASGTKLCWNATLERVTAPCVPEARKESALARVVDFGRNLQSRA